MSKRKTSLKITKEYDGSCLVFMARSDEDMKIPLSEAMRKLLIDASCEHIDFTKMKIDSYKGRGNDMYKKGDKIRYIHSGYLGEIGKIIKVEKDEKLDHFRLKYEVELFRNGHRVWVREDWIELIADKG